jgi:hypothetical protein
MPTEMSHSNCLAQVAARRSNSVVLAISLSYTKGIGIRIRKQVIESMGPNKSLQRAAGY